MPLAGFVMTTEPGFNDGWRHPLLAAQASAEARNDPGSFTRPARGVPRDSKTAKKWFKSAIAQALEEARQNLEIVDDVGSPEHPLTTPVHPAASSESEESPRSLSRVSKGGRAVSSVLGEVEWPASFEISFEPLLVEKPGAWKLASSPFRTSSRSGRGEPRPPTLGSGQTSFLPKNAVAEGGGWPALLMKCRGAFASGQIFKETPHGRDVHPHQ